jgi:hypothetical protein
MRRAFDLKITPTTAGVSPHTATNAAQNGPEAPHSWTCAERRRRSAASDSCQLHQPPFSRPPWLSPRDRSWFPPNVRKGSSKDGLERAYPAKPAETVGHLDRVSAETDLRVSATPHPAWPGSALPPRCNPAAPAGVLPGASAPPDWARHRHRPCRPKQRGKADPGRRTPGGGR